jgi:hypothetical protein
MNDCSETIVRQMGDDVACRKGIYFSRCDFLERLQDYAGFARKNGLENTLFVLSIETKYEHQIDGWYSIGIYDTGYYLPLFDIYLGHGSRWTLANDYLKSVCKEIGVYNASV